MVRITFVSPSTRIRTLEVRVGGSLMEAAVDAGINGIVGECGGNALCATCHVYVDVADLDRVPPMTAIEDTVLDSTAAVRTAASRLSCQVTASPEIDGLVVHLPRSQI